MISKSSNRSGVVLAIVGGMCWGFSGVFGQFLLEHRGLNAHWLVTVRLLLAGSLLIIIACIKQKEPSTILRIFSNKIDLIKLLIYSIIGMGACQFSYYSTIEASNAGTATVLQYTGPILIMLWVSLQEKKSPTISEFFALILTILGTFFIATHGNLSTLAISKETLWWGIVASVSLATYNIIGTGIMKKYGTDLIIGYGMVISGIVLIPFTKPWHVPGVWDHITFLMMGIVIIVGTILSSTLYLKGVTLIGAKRASMLAASEPLTSTIFTACFLGVIFSIWDILGLFLIILGVTAISFFSKEDEILNK